MIEKGANHLKTGVKSYRPEIDGLRSIAVLSVIFYHLKITVDGKNLIPGGFIGVDVFFVISGYLISSILITGINSKTFSFINFYERRARRILPVLLLVMTLSLPLAWHLLLPTDFIDYSYQLITGLFFSSNFYFWLEDPYWASESSLKPFLHTWSLGVEEQFYVLMPLLLLAISRWIKASPICCLVFLLLLSLFYAQWESHINPQSSFYLLPSRAWEMLAGACLACIPSYAQCTPSARTRNLPLVGFLFVLFSIFWFDSQTLHPSFFTLIPIIGTMLIIHFANDSDVAIRILKSRGLVGIGLISYGLYIWHFPIFAFTQVTGSFDDPFVKIALVIGVFTLSVVSYFWLEKPARNFSVISSKNFILFTASWVAVVILIAYAGTLTGFKHRVPDFLNQPVKPEKVDNHRWYLTSIERKGRIILVGDSHTNAIAPSIMKWALRHGYDFANSGFPGCMMLIDSVRVGKEDFAPHRHCTAETQQERQSFLTNAEPSIVFVGGRLPLILEEDRFDNKEGAYEGEMKDFIQNLDHSLHTKMQRQDFISEQYRKTVQVLAEAGHQVVLIYPIPEVGWHVPKVILDRVRGDLANADKIVKSDPVTTSYDVFIDRTKSSYELLDSIQGARVHRVFPAALFCDSAIPDRCVTHNREHLFYRDDDHLSIKGAELLVEELVRAIATIESARS